MGNQATKYILDNYCSIFRYRGNRKDRRRLRRLEFPEVYEQISSRIKQLDVDKKAGIVADYLHDIFGVDRAEVYAEQNGEMRAIVVDKIDGRDLSIFGYLKIK